MENVVIVSGARTPIGRFGGSLRQVPVYQLGALVLNAALQRAGIAAELVDEVIMGQAYQNGECACAARFALLEAGWPEQVTAITLDRRCCSGLDAVLWGAMKIQTGNADIMVVGGLDSMSQAELYLPGDIRWGLGGRIDPKWGFMPGGHGALSMWGLALLRPHPARAAHEPAHRPLRRAQLHDDLGRERRPQRGHQPRGRRPVVHPLPRPRRGRLGKGAVQRGGGAVPLKGKKGEDILSPPTRPRAPTPPWRNWPSSSRVYQDGVCTAGNSSSENDGAAALVLASERKGQRAGSASPGPLPRRANAACDPTLTYPAVDIAVKKALAKSGLGIGDIDLFEIQEAFAVQMLADAKLMGIPAELTTTRKLNVNGSGISLGHPIGATGAMRLVTLLHQMRRQQARHGLLTICGGGGQGVAAVFEGL